MVAILVEETDVSPETAEELLGSEDPMVRRQVRAVIESVISRAEFDAVMARHRARFGRATANA